MRTRREQTIGLFAATLLAGEMRAADFQATQTTFVESAGNNTVLLEWTDPAAASGEIQIRDGEAVIATVSGVTGHNSFTIESAPAGDHTYSASGPGGSFGSQAQTVLDTWGDMIGPLDSSQMACRTEGAGEECEIVIDWKTGIPPPTFYEVILDGELDHVNEQVFPTTATLAATTGGEHRITIQPVKVSQSPPIVGRFEQPAIECVVDVTCLAAPGNRFVRGLCDGVGDLPGMSSAVRGLNYLFLGGRTPPCLEACDTNSSGAPGEPFDLSDMVHVLSFLFLGGPAPPSWGGPAPVCETATPGDDCLESHAACAN